MSGAGDVQVGEIAGGDCAIATHRGSYAGLAKSYRWIYGEWLPQSGRVPADTPAFERYLNDPHETTEHTEQDLFTKICVPLKR